MNTENHLPEGLQHGCSPAGVYFVAGPTEPATATVNADNRPNEGADALIRAMRSQLAAINRAGEHRLLTPGEESARRHLRGAIAGWVEVDRQPDSRDG